MDAKVGKSGDSARSDVILEPLNFNLKKPEPDNASDQIPCLICSDAMDTAQDFVHHMVLAHNIVIADSKLIADMKRYANHWRRRFLEKGFAEFCTEIKFNPNFGQTVDDSVGDPKCYLLCNALPEDCQLREELQRMRLEDALAQSQKERDQTDFNKPCPFCKLEIYGNRKNLIEHLAVEHQFNIGQPNNLVYVNELMDLLDEKFNRNLQCLMCERKFLDRGTLKEHVRKKQHKQLNPKNTQFDKYYLINYLEIGKNWQDVMAEDDAKFAEFNSDDETELSDWWKEDLSAVCLFCDFVNVEGSELMTHMKVGHGFDFQLFVEEKQLSFYHQVKLINYIRRSMYQRRCFYCLSSFASHEELVSHLTDEKHMGRVPDPAVWDQSQYLIPTYENDNLLCKLEAGESGDDLEDAAGNLDNVVVSEDLAVNVEDSVLKDSIARGEI